MSIVIISSTQDTASTNIKNALLTQSSWEEQAMFFKEPYYKSTAYPDLFMLTIPDKTILHEGLEQEIKDHIGIHPEKAIFISRHRSKTGSPSLTTHPIGNFGKALFGGKTNQISPSLPHHMTALLRLIAENAKKEKISHQVCFEVTHHGPYMSIPTLFAEVGSTEDEWKKQKPAEIIATSLLQLLDRCDEIHSKSDNIPILLGIGGGHYAPRFTDVALEKDVAFSHMIPSYHIDEGTITQQIFSDILKQAAPFHGVYLHRKALKKSQQTQFKLWCQEQDVPILSSNDFTDIC